MARGLKAVAQASRLSNPASRRISSESVRGWLFIEGKAKDTLRDGLWRDARSDR
jgi:hypothetical protein